VAEVGLEQMLGAVLLAAVGACGVAAVVLAKLADQRADPGQRLVNPHRKHRVAARHAHPSQGQREREALLGRLVEIVRGEARQPRRAAS
jgi:hypothetical protein